MQGHRAFLLSHVCSGNLQFYKIVGIGVKSRKKETKACTESPTLTGIYENNIQ